MRTVAKPCVEDPVEHELENVEDYEWRKECVEVDVKRVGPFYILVLAFMSSHEPAIKMSKTIENLNRYER